MSDAEATGAADQQLDQQGVESPDNGQRAPASAGSPSHGPDGGQRAPASAGSPSHGPDGGQRAPASAGSPSHHRRPNGGDSRAPEPDEAQVVGAQGEPEPDPDPPAEPLDPVAEAERERDEYLDHLRRERAEFENFRKRATRERMDALDRGAEQVVASLLHVLDTFGFALSAAADRPEDQLAKGVQMVHAELISTLKQAGLEEVDGVGAHFDPMHHEAMMQVEADEPVDEPTVVEVLRPGYRFKGRVLRPAAVKVAK